MASDVDFVVEGMVINMVVSVATFCVVGDPVVRDFVLPVVRDDDFV